jgi:uncharacterized protein YbaR (Trm112 family)
MSEVAVGLELEDAVEEHGGEIKSGTLVCRSCNTRYPIRNFIPRFVPDDGYAESFGKQWNRLSTGSTG